MPDTINTTETIDDFGLLFLFDVVGSTSAANQMTNTHADILYKTILVITDSVLSELNKHSNEKIIRCQSTGDGFYLFCKNPLICIELWQRLTFHFNEEHRAIRCGASFGKVNINAHNIGSNLGNIVSRCCSYTSIDNSLCITSTLYELIKSSDNISIADISIEELKNTSLKGLDDIKTLYLFRNKSLEHKEVNNPTVNYHTKPLFVGRDSVLEECFEIAQDILNRNALFNIHGISGVGKTTLAITIAHRLSKSVICIDLRQINTIQAFHRTIIDQVYDRIVDKRLIGYISFNSLENTVLLLRDLQDSIIVFDHSELLEDNEYADIKNLLCYLNHNRIRIILTSISTQNIQDLSIEDWKLNIPSNEEKVDMLAHWMKVRNLQWLVEFSSHITNHSYLICLIGRRYKGNYSKKNDILRILNHMNETENISEYLWRIVDQIPKEERFWIYLAYICSGSIYSNALPIKTKKTFDDLGLIKELGVFVTFHPLVMKVVEDEYSDIDYYSEVYCNLSKIDDEKSKTLIEYYNYLCQKSCDSDLALNILINNWQAWSEEIDSFKIQALIEEFKNKCYSSTTEVQLNLFLNIIRIFQGQKDDLRLAIDMFSHIWEENNHPLILRLLAHIEYIECRRKIDGPDCAVSLLYNDLESINQIISTVSSNEYIYYGKHYYLGTVFFLLGNILRSLEDNKNAIEMYKASLSLIEQCDPTLRNADLQKIHIAYGIAESYLKIGQYSFSIELANETLRTVKTTSKFGIALLYLLKGRAYLCESFADKKNYTNGIKSIKKAEELFESIHLPNYLQRCSLVEAAFYAKSNKKIKARNVLVKLSEHLTGTDDLAYRSNILLNSIMGIHGIISDNDLEIISMRKGRQIGIFYQNLAQKSVIIPKAENRPSFKLSKYSLEKTKFTYKVSDETGSIWFVD